MCYFPFFQCQGKITGGIGLCISDDVLLLGVFQYHQCTVQRRIILTVNYISSQSGLGKGG